MIAIGELHASVPPRDEALVRRGVAWLEPWWKTALFALPWLWLATVPAGIVIGLGILASLPFIDHFPVPAWYANTIVIAGGVAFAAMWIPFARRARRRRARARTLVERGAVIVATSASVQQRTYRAAVWYQLALVFEHDGRRHGVVVKWPGRTPPAEIPIVPILFEPSVPYCVVFAIGPRPHRATLRA